MHKYLFFFFYFFFKLILCVFPCECSARKPRLRSDSACLRQTDRHTVRAAPGAVLAPGPEAMWKARSGFSSTHTNLSPFTKDFRGGEHPRVYGIFGSSASAEHHLSVYSQVCSLFSSLFLWLGPLCSSGLFRRAWWWFPKAWRRFPAGASYIAVWLFISCHVYCHCCF